MEQLLSEIEKYAVNKYGRNEETYFSFFDEHYFGSHLNELFEKAMRFTSVENVSKLRSAIDAYILEASHEKLQDGDYACKTNSFGEMVFSSQDEEHAYEKAKDDFIEIFPAELQELAREVI